MQWLSKGRMLKNGSQFYFDMSGALQLPETGDAQMRTSAAAEQTS